MTRSAVIGCGDVSIVHLEAIEGLDSVELVGICDIDAAAAQEAHRKYDVPAFTDHRALFEVARPEVVHICTPHDRHVPVALDCLARGIHVVLEKPVAATVPEAERLIAAAAAHPDVKIGVCFQNRYNVATSTVRELLDSGELGAVLGGHGTVVWHRTPQYYAARPWRGTKAGSGGGVLINQAIHTIDLLQWFLGEVSSVGGYVGRTPRAGGPEVEDSAVLTLDHRGGARSVLFATTANVVDSPVTVEIDTEAATLTIRDDLTIHYKDGRVEVVPERHAASGGRSYWGVSHERLIADFYRRLSDPEPFWITPREAAKSLRVIEQAYALPA